MARGAKAIKPAPIDGPAVEDGGEHARGPEGGDGGAEDPHLKAEARAADGEDARVLIILKCKL